MTTWIRVTVVALAASTWLAGQEPPALQLQIVSPVEGAYVSDRISLEARILPREQRNKVTDVTFYADGKMICRVTNVQLPRCEWDAGALIKPHSIRVVAALANGERLVATSRTRAVDFNESVSVRVVQVNTSVIDRRGVFVRGLTREQFKVLEDGQPQVITHFAAEEAPLELVVAMDVSGSMGFAIDDLKQAVRQFLSKLRPADQVTLVAFNEEMFVLTQRESNSATLDQAVDRLTAWGGTALYDVVIRSLKLLSRQQGRRGLIVFSDGEDQASQATLAEVDRAVKGSDATLFTVGLGRSQDQKALRDTLEQLSEGSGGRALFADRPSELGPTFAELLEELTNQYLIGYESTNLKKDGAWRKVEVSLPNTRHRVRARQGYFGPAS